MSEPSSGAEAARDGGRGAAAGDAEGVGPRLYTVSGLSRAIRQRLDAFGRVSVEGEVSRIVRAASGHLYFDLKDFEAKIACTLWRSAIASALRFELAEGQQVVVHGKLDVYAPRGTYSLSVQRIEQKGIGALLIELERLKAELKQRGWFERRRPLPKLPRVVGVATSRDGAAFQDFLRTRSLRWPLYPVRLAHTPVLGAGAAREVATAIDRLDASGVDVIVVCRGGGSLEDLWAFTELAVAEAIRRASVPGVCGVGHEVDVTLADLVADHRAHTPTDAAQCVIPDRAALEAELERLANWLGAAVDQALRAREERLERASRSRCLRGTAWMLDDRASALARSARLLRMAADARLARARARIDAVAARLAGNDPRVRFERALRERALAAFSPYAVLARGYSITMRRGGREPLRDGRALADGEELETRLADGWVVSRVERAEGARDAGAAASPADEGNA